MAPCAMVGVPTTNAIAAWIENPRVTTNAIDAPGPNPRAGMLDTMCYDLVAAVGVAASFSVTTKAVVEPSNFLTV